MRSAMTYEIRKSLNTDKSIWLSQILDVIGIGFERLKYIVKHISLVQIKGSYWMLMWRGLEISISQKSSMLMILSQPNFHKSFGLLCLLSTKNFPELK